MDSFEINEIVLSDPTTSKNFLGVFPIDKLPQQKPNCNYKTTVIINLDKSSMPGSHWVCCQLNPVGVSEYFDSYGRQPLVKIQKYLLKNSKNCYIQNKDRYQPVLTSVCGIYCIYCVTCWGERT